LELRRLLSNPIVITQGGTYSGTWESLDPDTPAVTISTTQPVTIDNSTLSSRGTLIASAVNHTNLTVRNSTGYGLNPNRYGAAPGRFIDLENFDNVVIQNNSLQNTAGIYLLNYSGDHSSSDTIKVTGNSALNIDGRKSDGNGGWLDFNTRTRKSDGYTEDGMEMVQFLQFDKVYAVAGIDIGWNKVINQPGNSRVEDNINIYKSSGTSGSPILIHDNYIQGAYTIKPWQADTSDSTYDYDWSFSGGGIMLGDGVGTGTSDPSFVKAYGNTIVDTTNYGIAISSGHDESFYNNRIVSDGKLPDGRTIQNQNVGAYVWDSYDAGSSHFYNDSGHDNTIGWVQGSSRNDWWAPVSSNMPNNIHMPGPITSSTEAAELASWQQRHDAIFISDQPPLDTIVNSGTVLKDALPEGSVTINGGTRRLSAHADGDAPSASVITGLSIAPGGVLDLTNNALIIDYPSGSTSPLASVEQWIASGRNGAAWNGSGITSSTAAASGKLYTVAVAEASDVLALSQGQTAMFQGQRVDDTAILVRFTYAGDANLDGKINIDDYGRIDSSFASGPINYSHGDFNFDKKHTIDDYGIIDANAGLAGLGL
jgi:hypothetical protein